LGQSMSDFDIFYHLAKKMGIEDELYEGDFTDEAWVKRLFDASSLPKFINYEEFKKNGYFVFPFPENYVPAPSLRWFYEKADGLATPSGKIELYSKLLADHYGADNPEIPAVPKYIEPKEGRKGPIANKYPLVAFVSHPKFRFHTMMECVSWLRELHKIKGPEGREYEPLWMNPGDGKSRGIKHGDIVVVFNERGESLGAAYLTEKIKPGVVRMFYGSFWEPENPRLDKSLDKGGSFNVLTTSEPMSCHAHLQKVHHTMVDIRKWKNEV
jgi:anaerobic selenocysteine-containing dehydrogenase